MPFAGYNPVGQIILCSTCINAISRPQDHWNYNQTSHYIYGERAVEDLIISARNNCRICRLFWETIPAKDLKRLFERGSMSMWLYWNPESLLFERLEMDSLQFQLIPTTAMQATLSSSLLPQSTASEACLMLMREWIMKCITSHTRCRPEQDRSLTQPTRLIDIGCHSWQELRLVMTSELESRDGPIQYVALSHFWGAYAVTKLLKTNLIHFQERIPLQSLSQTFRDAVEITRKLTFRYLWIDSLCIVQDCPEDWLRESSAMQDVYKGCICNIAATAASEGSDSMFAQRDPLLMSPFIININWKDHQKQYICFRGAVRYSGFIKAPLNRRGWVIQERLLSPRTIHFSSQLFWECKELEACETYPKGLPEGLNIEDEEENSRFYGFRLQGKSWLNDIRSNPDSKYDIWEAIVESFMCCGLTKEEDKLVALSGLVKEMQPLMNDEYVAGMWRKNLTKELVWLVEDSKQVDSTNAFRPDAYRAPSWSWASIEGRVVYPALEEPINPLVTILDVQITPRTTDPTGQVLGGWAQLSAKLKRLPDQIPEDVWLSPSVSTGFCIDEGDFTAGEDGLFILPVLSFERDDEEAEFIGLILQPSKIESNVFRRVGLLLQNSIDTSGTIPGLEWDFAESDWKLDNDGVSAQLKVLIII